MLERAEAYSKELSGRYRTLSCFTNHPGEIGRSHEEPLRHVIRRLLPGKLSADTGFVMRGDWTSAQQDVLIYNSTDFAPLDKNDDNVVVDEEAFLAAIEVKTKLDASALRDALATLMSFVVNCGRGGTALFAWEGTKINKLYDVIWETVREDVPQKYDQLPKVICIRGQGLLVRNMDGKLASAPFHFLDLQKDDVTEGLVLLAYYAAIWRAGVFPLSPPQWLEEVERLFGEISDAVPWPEDIQVLAELHDYSR